MARYYSAVSPQRQQQVLDGEVFAVAECLSCGLIFQGTVPTSAVLGELYGEWLGKNDPLAPSKPPMPLDYYTYMAQEIMQLVAYMQKRRGLSARLRFLDYGMGWGNWAQMAQSFGVEVYGVELSPAKIAHGESLGIKMLLPEQLPSHRFDFICTEQVIEHVTHPRDMVASLTDLLAQGGLLKISVPDGSGTKAVLRSWKWEGAQARQDDIMPIHPMEHLNCFTPESLNKLAQGCGLKPVSLPLSLVYAYTTDWSSARLAAKNVLRPIKRFVQHRGCYGLFERA